MVHVGALIYKLVTAQSEKNTSEDFIKFKQLLYHRQWVRIRRLPEWSRLSEAFLDLSSELLQQNYGGRNKLKEIKMHPVLIGSLPPYDSPL